MKLTKKDKNYLLSIGYNIDDLSEIENTIQGIRYEMFFTKNDTTIKLTQKQVIGMLGRESFLSGVGRATFHQTAVRTSVVHPNVGFYFEKK